MTTYIYLDNSPGTPWSWPTFITVLLFGVIAYQLEKVGILGTGAALGLFCLSSVFGLKIETVFEIRIQNNFFREMEAWFAAGESLEAYRNRSKQAKGDVVCEACGSTRITRFLQGSAYKDCRHRFPFGWVYQSLWHFYFHKCDQCNRELWRSKDS